MNKLQLAFLQASAILTAASGIIFAWMKYGMKSNDPFAVVNHPWQPFMLSAHVLVSPMLVFAFGWILNDHILAKFRNPTSPQRGSGIPSMAAIVPMILSGYLLQISTADATRQAMAVVHWMSSGLFVIAYAVHIITRPPKPAPLPED